VNGIKDAVPDGEQVFKTVTDERERRDSKKMDDDSLGWVPQEVFLSTPVFSRKNILRAVREIGASVQSVRSSR